MTRRGLYLTLLAASLCAPHPAPAVDCAPGFHALNLRPAADERQNSFFLPAANAIPVRELQWHALATLENSSLVPARLREVAADKLKYFKAPAGENEWHAAWAHLPKPACVTNAAEFALARFTDAGYDTEFRGLLIDHLKNSPHAGLPTIERLLPIAAGARSVADQEIKQTAEAIRAIADRTGGYPARFAAESPRADARDILLHEPVEAVKPLGGGMNVSLVVKFANGHRAVFKPREGEVFYNASDPARVDFVREAGFAPIVDKFLGNAAAFAAGRSPVHTAPAVTAVLVHEGKNYGVGSLQAFADGYFDIQKISTDPRYGAAWRSLQAHPKWRLIENHLRTIDYLMGNYDRLPLAINGRGYPKNFMVKVDGADLSDPAKLGEMDWGQATAVMIDNGFGRNAFPKFTIEGYGHFPLRRDIPADLRNAIQNFDEAAFRAEMADQLPPLGINDVIGRIQAAQNRIRSGP